MSDTTAEPVHLVKLRNLTIRTHARPLVLSALSAAASGPIDRVTERSSRNGNYIALAIRVELDAAENVLEVYEVLSALDGVMTTM